MQNKTNWLAIIVAAIAGMVLGFLWYGVLFMEPWMVGNGISLSDDELQMFKDGKEVAMSPLPMIINTVAMIIYALIMDWLIKKTSSTNMKDGAILGAVIGFVGLMLVYVSNRFSYTPTSLSMLDGSYTLILFIIIGAIIGGWRK